MRGDASGMGDLLVALFWLIAASSLFLLTLLAYSIVPSLRRERQKLPKLLVGLCVVLATPATIALPYLIYSLILVWLANTGKVVAERVAAADPQNYGPAVVAGIQFPIGSVISHKQNGDGSQSIVSARSAVPVKAGDLMIHEIRFSEYDSREVLLQLAGPQDIEGWPCDPKMPAHFSPVVPSQELTPSNWTMTECTLSSTYQLAGMPPFTAKLGKLTDGSGWKLDDADLEKTHFEVVNYSGFVLKDYLSFYLDTERKIDWWTSILGHTTRFGEIDYPAGTRIRHFRNGKLVFEVGNYAPNAINTRTNEKVEACVVHSDSGKVIRMYSDCKEAFAAAYK